MTDTQKLEEVLKLMVKYRVNAVKVGDIEVAGVQLPIIEENSADKASDDEEDEDLLFYSAGN